MNKVKDAFCIKTFCWHGIRISTKIVCIGAVIVVLFGGLSVWRMSSGPLDIGFAKDIIEGQLRNDESGVSASIEQVVLYWPELRGPILVGLRGGRVVNKEMAEIAFIDEAAFSFSLPRLLVGDLLLKTLIVKKPVLRVVRRVDDGFMFEVADYQESDIGPHLEHFDDQSDLLSRIVGYMANPNDAAGESSSPLASLVAFQIQDAQILIEDRVIGETWSVPKFNGVFESTRKGLHAALYFDLPPNKDEGALSYVKAMADYAWAEKELNVALNVQNFDLGFVFDKMPDVISFGPQDVVFDGEVKGAFGEGFVPKSLEANLISGSGFVAAPELSDEPIPYEGFRVVASYDGDVQQLDITDVRVNLQGVDVSGGGEFVYKEGQVSGPVRVAVKDLKQSDIGRLWPKSLNEDNSKEWIVDRVHGGVYTEASAVLDVLAVRGDDNEWAVDVPELVADFKFEDMSVNYRAPLSPVTNSSGSGHFDLSKETLSVKVESGKVDDLDVLGGQVELTNIIKAGAGIADVKIQLDGPLKSVLLFADKEPIEIGKKVDFDIKKTKGHAKLDVHVTLPTLNDVLMEQVSIDVSGVVNDVFIPDVLKGLALTGGPLNIHVTNDQIKVVGDGMIMGGPVELEWMEYLESDGKKYLAQTKAKALVSPKLREHFGIILDDFIEGPVGVDVVYTEYPKHRAVAQVDVDLAPTRLFISPFDFEKPVGVQGRAQFKATLQNGDLTKITVLSANAPDFQLENSELSFAQDAKETKLVSGTVSRFMLGETDANLEFKIDGDGKVDIKMSGPFLDLQPLINNDGEENIGDNIPLVASVNVVKMRTSKDEVVSKGRIYADITDDSRFNQLELDAVAGAGNIYLRYKPDELGDRRFRFEADDAGAALRAFGVYENIVGGKILVYADPVGELSARTMKGVAQISDFSVVKAPAMARLFGAVSLPGLVETLGNEGILFSRGEANFDWLGRRGGGLVSIQDGRTSGNSLGLTFEGELDQAQGTVDVSGTIVPLSGVNNVIASIPLIGDILTGGSGGVFAATYKIKGKAEEPEISVNPLSVLAPGILRRILFE